MSERFNVLMCKFYKFNICAVVGIIIEYSNTIMLLSLMLRFGFTDCAITCLSVSFSSCDFHLPPPQFRKCTP